LFQSALTSPSKDQQSLIGIQLKLFKKLLENNQERRKEREKEKKKVEKIIG